MIVSRINDSGDKQSDSQYIVKVKVAVFLGIVMNTFLKKISQMILKSLAYFLIKLSVFWYSEFYEFFMYFGHYPLSDI